MVIAMKKSFYPIIAILFSEIFIISTDNLKAQTYRILPLGNSITEGTHDNINPPVGDRIAYRKELYDQLTGRGYSFDFVGHDNAGYNLLSDADQGGIPGSRAQYVVRLLQDGYDLRWSEQITPAGEPYLDVYPADIILLHIGTNDITHGEGSSAADVEDILDEIDAWEASSGTHVTVFLAQIIQRIDDPADNLTTLTFNDNLATMVAGRGDPSVILVDMETGAGIDYSTEIMADGIHPLQSAYDKMGDTWYASLDAYLDAIPNPPGGLILSGETANSIDLSWTDNSDNETGFEIERSLSSSGGSFTLIRTIEAGRTSYTDDLLNEETKYYYRVRAVNETGPSLYTSIKNTFTLPAPPLPPGDLSVGDSTTSSLTLTWTDNSDNESGFLIQRSLTSGTGFADIHNTAANITSYTDTGLDDDTQYFYRICATSVSGNSPFTQEANGTTLLALPDPPTGLNFDNIAPSSIRLNWTDNSDNEVGFEIRRSGLLTGSYDLVHITGKDTTSYADSSLKEDTEYFYRVNAVNAAGMSTYISGSATTLVALPAPPGNLHFDNITTSSICLSWTDNSDNEDGFEIRRSESLTGSYDLIYTRAADAVSYIDNGLKEGIEYFYRVNAVNAAGISAYISGSATTLVSLPLSPGGLHFDSITTSSIRLNWTDNSTNENGFEIRRSESFSGIYELVYTTGMNVIKYIDEGLKEGTGYFYRVNAVNAAGASPYVNGSATTLVHEIDTTQQNVIEADTLFTFYPNPNSGNITVTVRYWDKNVKSGYLRLADFSGKVHLTEDIDLSDGLPWKVIEFQLPNSLKNGFYSLVLIAGDRCFAEKLILMR
jgi:fibronectin type 3 domain-containing protein